MRDFKPEWLDDWIGYLDGTDLDLEDHELRMTHQDGFAAGFVAGCESENARLTADLADARATIARLTAAVERALQGLEAWKRLQQEIHPWHVDGWKIEEEVRAALAPRAGAAVDGESDG